MNTDSQTYEYDFDGERIVITEQEVREFYSETYRLTKQDIKGSQPSTQRSASISGRESAVSLLQLLSASYSMKNT